MYASLDLHKKYAQACVMDEVGAVRTEERIESDRSLMEKFSNTLEEGTNIVIESSSTWYWVYEILARKHHVVLANPARTKAIAQAKIKTDKIDAITLANLLRGGYIAESYIPSKKVMELRGLVRYRASLVRMRSNLKNKIHAYLLMNNIKMEEKKSPFSKAYIEELRTKIDDPKVQGYLNILSSIEEEISEASSHITKEAINNEDAKLLMTIPGVSFYSALMIVAEIGDISRFTDSHHLMSYAGLIPSTHSSGGTTYHGRITKTGSPHLRWILNQCAWSNIRSVPEGNLALFYFRLRRKKGSGKAVTATSAKLLRIIYQMLKNREQYHCEG